MTSLRLPELLVLVLDLVEQLGVADGDADLAGVQVEQRLVGAFPGPRRGQARQQQADPLVAGAQLGADRDRDAGDPLLRLRRVGIDEQDDRSDEAEGGSASRPARSAIASTPSRGSADSTAARIRPS